MSSVGLFEAKQRLSELVERVRKGESIAITRRGVVVARLVSTGLSRENRRDAARAIRVARQGVRLGALSLRALIDEGRA